MDEFPKNSRRVTPREEETEPKKKIDRVTTNAPVRRKKSLGKKFSETFLRGDARTVVTDVLQEVIIPAAKDLIADAITQGLERLIFGESRSRSRSSRPPFNGPYSRPATNYNNRYAGSSSTNYRPDITSPSPRSTRTHSSHNFDDIVLSTRVEAEEVVDQLFALLGKYEIATVADLYELVGITGEYTDEKWGWIDLQGTNFTRVREGYLLNLPKPEPIN
jgi:hypothetical protein